MRTQLSYFTLSIANGSFIDVEDGQVRILEPSNTSSPLWILNVEQSSGHSSASFRHASSGLWLGVDGATNGIVGPAEHQFPLVTITGQVTDGLILLSADSNRVKYTRFSGETGLVKVSPLSVPQPDPIPHLASPTSPSDSMHSFDVLGDEGAILGTVAPESTPGAHPEATASDVMDLGLDPQHRYDASTQSAKSQQYDVAVQRDQLSGVDAATQREPPIHQDAATDAPVSSPVHPPSATISEAYPPPAILGAITRPPTTGPSPMSALPGLGGLSEALLGAVFGISRPSAASYLAQGRLHCPSGHPLTAVVRRRGIVCDACDASLGSNVRVLRCAYTCDFDICVPCGTKMADHAIRSVNPDLRQAVALVPDSQSAATQAELPRTPLAPAPTIPAPQAEDAFAAVPPARCTDGHPLRASILPYSTHCALCGETRMQGDVVFSCGHSTCNSTICDSCHAVLVDSAVASIIPTFEAAEPPADSADAPDSVVVDASVADDSNTHVEVDVQVAMPVFSNAVVHNPTIELTPTTKVCLPGGLKFEAPVGCDYNVSMDGDEIVVRIKRSHD